MKVAVLGAGMVGSAIAMDLASRHHVTAFDVSNANLELLKKRNPRIEIRQADLRDYSSYPHLLTSFDIIVTAVPGFMGYKTLEAAINCGKNIVDISFFPEDVLQLDQLAKEKGVTVITDCGVAPGMSNFIIGHHNEEMKIEALEIYVGGLPKVRKKPFQYKAPFSPADVIEEYTRPARLMENGHIIVRPALSEVEWLHFEDLGTLEAFNTDGLRSLLYTMPHIKNQKEKTMRYPGHVDIIISLKESGFFSETPIDINGTKIAPIKVTSQILFNEWKLGLEEEELTVMKVKLTGNKDGESKTIEWNLLDFYDHETKISSMARTTGYTCTAAVNLLAQDLFSEKGVFPPELVGKHKKCFDFILDYLKERKVNWIKKEY
ncbi:MAG TPA: saccharopine dehydrogenase C-terminal domain-containing protein [Chitinophagaceae bacterium]|nr:saccharopine dehydrogenase C-terminal domain-containing protein [Chitinophagaceae bacterium]